MSFWDTTPEVVAELRETAEVCWEPNGWRNTPKRSPRAWQRITFEVLFPWRFGEGLLAW